MSTIGVMAMPANFKYRDVFLKGKPRHERSDRFWLRHPAMDVGHRAKIFAPFDALKGFSDAIAKEGDEAILRADAAVEHSREDIDMEEDNEDVYTVLCGAGE